LSNRNTLSNKEKLAQKVLVRAINECLRQKIFTLNPETSVPGKVTHTFDMAGFPALVGVTEHNSSQLALKVALWPTEHGKKFPTDVAIGSMQRRKRGGFFTSAWFERQDGAWLQTSEGLKVSCANAHRKRVEGMPSEKPEGYKAAGKFFK